ncbi:hypothetical protein [Thermus arciformis]|uniref:hypothetical protein n=1 Tax=Thermus arciformis TaxID=482827 RepID=UPI00115F8B11|nr:hypothetical protein [Thermus arciformis]
MLLLNREVLRKALKGLFSLGAFLAFAVLAYLFEQWSLWSGIQFLLGLGAVLVSHLAWGKGVTLNPPKALAVSLLGLVLFYVVLDGVFPGALAQRVSDLAVEPFTAGVLLGLFLFSPIPQLEAEGKAIR